ncbi:UNVERIFIED_CONTAM: hypothetical protein HHA_237595 [Hammondia hammondi]|eukprot:XP_008885395.1 hypothetical protein HHA_237595 [Hammondia hammondi]
MLPSSCLVCLLSRIKQLFKYTASVWQREKLLYSLTFKGEGTFSPRFVRTGTWAVFSRERTSVGDATKAQPGAQKHSR